MGAELGQRMPRNILAAQQNDAFEVEVVMGGPVTPLFQARSELKCKFLDFSQRRTKGYRKAFEFD